MISLFGRGRHKTYKDCLKFRYPLTQNKNFISNPNFEPNPPSRTDLPLYSLDVKGWDLSDVGRDPVWNNAGSLTASLYYVDGDTGPFSNYNYLNTMSSGNNYIVHTSKISNPLTGDPFRNTGSPTIRTSIHTHSDTLSTDLKSIRAGLAPGKTYTLALETVSEVATGSWTYVFQNTTKGEVYSNWGWGVSSVNDANVVLPAASTTSRETLESEIPIPTRFEPSDNYRLLLTYCTGTGTTAVKWSSLFKVSLKEAASNKTNKLTPDSKYRFAIEAQAEGTKFDHLIIPRKFVVLGVRVSTDIITDVYGRLRRYVYNFKESLWIDMLQNHYTRDLTRGVQLLTPTYDLNTSGGDFTIEGTTTPYVGRYHRMNENGIVKYMEGRFHAGGQQRMLTPINDNHYARDLMKDGVLFSIPSPTKFTQKLEFDFDTLGGTNIHNADTSYYIEFFRVQGPNPERMKHETRIDVHGITGYDLGLKELTSKQFNTADYDREDVASIIRYFDDIVSTYKLNSRNSSDSTLLAGPSGGGRSEMLTPYGGSYRTNADDSGTTFGWTTAATTTLYEI
tara:strand:+ start:1 stop:1686 length:1686 start_codon:yes stop_codon:yes gene_type:complete